MQNDESSEPSREEIVEKWKKKYQHDREEEKQEVGIAAVSWIAAIIGIILTIIGAWALVGMIWVYQYFDEVGLPIILGIIVGLSILIIGVSLLWGSELFSAIWDILKPRPKK